MSEHNIDRINALGEEASRLRPDLERYARRLTADNVSLAADLVSDAIQYILEGQSEINSVELFLRRIIKSRYIDHIRRHETSNISLDIAIGGNPLIDFLPSKSDGEDEMVDSIWRNQFADWLSGQLRVIDPRRAEAFRMYYIEDLTLAEIAQRQGVAISTAQRRIERAKEVLVKAAAIWMEEKKSPQADRNAKKG